MSDAPNQAPAIAGREALIEALSPVMLGRERPGEDSRSWVERAADAVLALLPAQPQSAGASFAGGDRALYIRLTDDGQHIRKWDRKPFNGGLVYYAEGVQPAAPSAPTGEDMRVLLPEEPSEAVIRAVDKAVHEHWPNARKMAVGMYRVIREAALTTTEKAAKADDVSRGGVE